MCKKYRKLKNLTITPPRYNVTSFIDFPFFLNSYIRPKKKKSREQQLTCALLVMDPHWLGHFSPNNRSPEGTAPCSTDTDTEGLTDFPSQCCPQQGDQWASLWPPRPCYFTLPFPGYMVWEPDFTSCNFLIVPPMNFKTPQLGRWLCPRQGVDDSREQRTGPYTGQKGERWVGFLPGHTLLSIPGEEHSLLSPRCSRSSNWFESEKRQTNVNTLQEATPWRSQDSVLRPHLPRGGLPSDPRQDRFKTLPQPWQGEALDTVPNTAPAPRSAPGTSW